MLSGSFSDFWAPGHHSQSQVSTASISDDHLVVDIYVSFMHVMAELIVVIKSKTRLMHVQACL